MNDRKYKIGQNVLMSWLASPGRRHLFFDEAEVVGYPESEYNYIIKILKTGETFETSGMCIRPINYNWDEAIEWQETYQLQQEFKIKALKQKVKNLVRPILKFQ